MKFNKQVFIFCLVGFLISCVLGSLAHFFYEWFGKSNIAALFFPVNESTWEHLKLAIFPTLIYFFFGLTFIKSPNYLFSFFIVLLIPIILIPFIFFTYTAFTKSPILIIDILSYFISIFVAFLFCYKILCFKPLSKN